MPRVDRYYKDGVILFPCYPYKPLSALEIDKLARKRICEFSRSLRSQKFEILFGPEIECVLKRPNLSTIQNCAQIINVLHNKNDESSFLNSSEIAKQDCRYLELFFQPRCPKLFLKGLGYLKNLLIVAENANTDYKFRFNLTESINKTNLISSPSFHINFSLWKNSINLFAKKSKMDNVTNFILNRLCNDIKETAFIFAQGLYSLTNFAQNGDKWLSPKIVTSRNVYFTLREKRSLFLRDYDKHDLSRVEIRRFNDNSGIQSLKVLMIIKSICDSLDQIISLTNLKSFNDLEKVNNNLEGKSLLVDHTSNPNYQLKSIFPPPGDDNISGRQILLDRFKNSQRAKEIFGDELHARICEADFTLTPHHSC